MTRTLEELAGALLLVLLLGVGVIGGSLSWILWQDDRYGFLEGSSPCAERYGDDYEYSVDFQTCRPIQKDHR